MEFKIFDEKETKTTDPNHNNKTCCFNYITQQTNKQEIEKTNKQQLNKNTDKYTEEKQTIKQEGANKPNKKEQRSQKRRSKEAKQVGAKKPNK